MNPLNTVRGAITTGVRAGDRAASRLAIVADGVQRVPARAAGCTSCPASCGSACSTTSTWCRSRPRRRRGRQGRPGRRGHQQVHRAARARGGSAGLRSPPGSRASGISPAASNLGAFALGIRARRVQHGYQLVIGIGAWLGTIMLFNVWVLIWPNQKKILGIVAGDGRGEGEGAQGRLLRLAHELRAVGADADVHGRAEPRPALLSRRAAIENPAACRVSVMPRRMMLPDPDYVCRQRRRGACGGRRHAAISPRSWFLPIALARATSSRAKTRSCAARPGSTKCSGRSTRGCGSTWSARDGDACAPISSCARSKACALAAHRRAHGAQLPADRCRPPRP